jgi:hypothetical protein
MKRRNGADGGSGVGLSYIVCTMGLLCGAAAGVVSAGLVRDSAAVSKALGFLLTGSDGFLRSF